MTGIRSQIEYYVRALRAPRISDGFGRLGDAAWSHEEYWPRSSLVKFPNAKPQELRQLRPSALRGPEPHRAPAHRGVPLRSQKRGPPRATGTGKTHLAVGIGIKAAKAGHRVLFDSVTAWFARLQEVHSRGKLAQELVKLHRYSPLVVDDVGYIPFDQEAANLFFQLVSSRYEHASVILTSNLPFARWATPSET
jgi:hypothetical protein